MRGSSPCRQRDRPAARAARTKARIFSRSLSPGARSTPDDTSTAGARVMRSASATLPASSPPESMNGTPGSRSLQQRASRTACRARRAGSPRAARGRRTAASRRPWHRRDRRQIGCASRPAAPSSPAARSASAPTHAFRRLLAVQLQHVGLERLDDLRASSASSASTESATFSARPCTRAPRAARGLEAEIARRRRKEHEADHVGAGIERGVEGLGGLQAADFDQKGHDGAGSSREADNSPPVIPGTPRRDLESKYAIRARGGLRARRCAPSRNDPEAHSPAATPASPPPDPRSRCRPT